jgi:hypothetical protein
MNNFYDWAAPLWKTVSKEMAKDTAAFLQRIMSRFLSLWMKVPPVC